jgi:hypothetical protein
MIVWWNASPNDWVYLSSFSDVQPSPAVEASPLLRLGEGDGDSLLGTATEGVQHRTERTQLGAFTRADYEDSLRQAGLEPHNDPDGLLGRGLRPGIKSARGVQLGGFSWESAQAVAITHRGRSP